MKPGRLRALMENSGCFPVKLLRGSAGIIFALPYLTGNGMLLIGDPGGGKNLKGLHRHTPSDVRRGLFSRRETETTEKPAGYGRLIPLVLCFILLPAQGLAQDNPDRALRLCLGDAAEISEPVPVTAGEDGPVFRSATGAGFVLADVVMPGGTDQDTTIQRSSETAGSRYLAYRAGPENRWGLAPAWVVSERENDRVLVQQVMLSSGKALVAPNHGTSDCTSALKWSEAVARRAGRGLWQDSKVLSTRHPEALLERAGHYVVAAGRIVSLGKTARTRYLNFGFRWKSDFTVTVKVSEEEAFDAVLGKRSMRVADLEGAAVLVRGVLQVRDGPYMELTHPGQLDVIDFKKGEE
jgi:hypothetical protein